MDAEVLARHGITSANRGSGEDWIALPIIVQGACVGRKYRTIAGEKRFLQDKGNPHVFWNHDCLLDRSLAAHPLVITEGEFDTLSALQAGFPRTVSWPDGAPMPSDAPIDDRLASRKYAWLDHYEAVLKGIKTVVLATDADAPGVQLLNDLALRLGKARCKFVKYPDGCKDLNDVLRLKGSDGVRRCIDGAEYVKVDGVYQLSELPPMPNPTPYDPELGHLSRHYRIRPGDFCVVSGIPGMGKSAFVTDLACRMARVHGWRVCVGSFETRIKPDYQRYLRMWFNGAEEDEQSPEELVRADIWIDNHFSFIVPADRDVDLTWIEEMIELAVIRYEAKMVILDPWNEIDHLPDPRESMTNYINHAIKRLKAIASKFDIHLIVVAHPTKMKRKEDGTYWAPTLYDIADSAAWANKCDVGIIIHREDSHKTTINVQKVRHHDSIGKPGKLSATFDTTTQHFYAIDEREPN